MNKDSKIFLAGSTGMVGSAILRALKKKEFQNVFIKSKKKLDLLNQRKTFNFFLNKLSNRPINPV